MTEKRDGFYQEVKLIKLVLVYPSNFLLFSGFAIFAYVIFKNQKGNHGIFLRSKDALSLPSKKKAHSLWNKNYFNKTMKSKMKFPLNLFKSVWNILDQIPEAYEFQV